MAGLRARAGALDLGSARRVGVAAAGETLDLNADRLTGAGGDDVDAVLLRRRVGDREDAPSVGRQCRDKPLS